MMTSQIDYLQLKVEYEGEFKLEPEFSFVGFNNGSH